MIPLALALNSALLHLVWQGAVVAFLLWIVLAALRRSSPGARYLGSCAALGILALLPVATACLAYRGPREIASVEARFVTVMFASPISEPANWLALVQAWMLPAWACGVALLSVRLLRGYANVSALKRTGDPAEPAVLAMVSRMSERVGVTRAVRVLISSLAGGPSVVGCLKPVILLPAATLLGLTPEQLEAVLAHELAHIRRYDYLVNVVQMLIETLFFYHPAVWWISGRIRQERELCCDDIAVRACGDAICYARALTALERMRVMSPSLALGAKDGPLMYRIQRLLGEAPQHAPREHGPARLPGMVAILLAITCFSTDMYPVKAQAPLPRPPAPPSAPVSLAALPQRPARALAQLAQSNPPASAPSADGPVTVEMTIDQNGEVSDARVTSGPMSQRRSALLMALGMRFPLESASTTQTKIFSAYPPGGMKVFSFYSRDIIPNGIQRVLDPAAAQERLTAARERIEKLRAQQAEASARGAAQLQEAIDSFSQVMKNLRQAASGQNPLAGKTLENILITGVQVSDSARDDLLAKLPVRLHDVLTEENMAATLSAVKGVYPDADAYFGTTALGQAGFRVTVPVR